MTVDLDALRLVSAADVYKAGVLAGTLERTDSGAVRFSYRPEYIGDPVAFTLPVGPDPVESPGGGLPPFFAGLLPEGHRLTVLRKAVKTSPDDELTMLLGVGADTPGDVQVVPAGTEPAEPTPLATSDPAEMDFRQLTEAPDRHALPGVQAKASASMLTTPVAAAGLRAILKIDRPDYPHLVTNEHLHLAGARALKLPVAAASVVHDRAGTPGLLVERFDRVLGPDGSVSRLAMEDAGQVLGMLPARKYNVDSEEVVAALAEATAAPLVAVRNLYLQFVFAWLTGNGDLHAKNLSVLRGANDRWVIAPVYDIPCTVLYDDVTMALPVDGKVRNLRRRHWAAFAASIGLNERAAAGANALALKAAHAIDLADLRFEGSQVRGAQRELRHRRYELDPVGGD